MTESIDYSHTLVIACATVMEDMLPLLPSGMQQQVLDFGLHINPGKLRTALQEAINAVGEDIETILLGYGLCSQALVGLKSDQCTMIVPRVDDCIAIFLGSRSAYTTQCHMEPGTYYLTKGWIEVGDTPFSEYDGMIERYGVKRAERLMKVMLGNYKRLALINTGQFEMEHFREYAQKSAERFGLRYEEIEGSNVLLKKMIFGPWDDEFVVVQPGEEIRYLHFALQ